MTGRFLGADVTDAEIARIARFLRRKAEQTHQNAVTLQAATLRVAEEAKRLVASAHQAAARIASRYGHT